MARNGGGIPPSVVYPKTICTLGFHCKGCRSDSARLVLRPENPSLFGFGYATIRDGLSERLRANFCKSSTDLQQPTHWFTCTERYRDALQAHRHSNQREPGQNGATHTSHINTRQTLLAVLGSSRHNPTLRAPRKQRIAGRAWCVGATSGIGAREPALRRALQ